jgi:hypothetical protein
MLSTFTAHFLARRALAVMFFLGSFTFASAKDEMTSSLLIGNARIDIRIEKSTLRVPTKEILHWVKSAAESVTGYYGRFPVPQVLIRITPFEGKGVHNGMTFGDRGGRIIIRVGNETSPSEFASDWMLTHEMVHLAFPSVDEKHHWIEEGIATYVEPIARIQREISQRSKCGLILSGTCPKASLRLAITDWTTRTLGEEPIGEEQCSASWPTLRFAARQTMRRGSSTPSVAFLTPTATFEWNGILRTP